MASIHDTCIPGETNAMKVFKQQLVQRAVFGSATMREKLH
jgi:hypothetical protein